MKNKFSDLHNHLFEQRERLNDDDLVGEKLAEEINRARAMAEIAGQLVAAGSLVLKAHALSEHMADKKKLLILTD
jgi:hypothetical protein